MGKKEDKQKRQGRTAPCPFCPSSNKLQSNYKPIYWPFAFRSMRVPLSSRTLLLLELITEPAVVEPEATDDNVMPGMPPTPWLVEVSPPAAFVAVFAPATLPVCTADPATLPVVFATPPAVEPTPPTSPPREPAAPEPEPLAMPPALPAIMAESSPSAAEAADSELPIAWIANDTGICVPSFRMAWSKAMPSCDSSCPLARA